MRKDLPINPEDKLKLNSTKACIVSVTKQGNELAKRIVEKVQTGNNELQCFTLEKYQTDGFKTFNNLDRFFNEAFENFDTIIAIMATGIVIRKIAPYLKSKIHDPGIIVLDVNGNNTISLLSGHLGHANENTLIISKAINSNPVITTASDNLGLISVDTLAEQLNAKIVNFNAAKAVTSLILQGKPVTIFSNHEISKRYNNLSVKDLNAYTSDKGGNIIISERDILNNIESESVQLYPKTVSIGIGTKKNINGDLVIEKIQKLLKLNNISRYSLNSLATIEEKRTEQGILKAQDYFGISLNIVDKQKILEVENLFKTSEFVRNNVGVGSVSEACGYLNSNKGIQIGNTLKEDGVSLSLWMRKDIY